MDGFYKKVLNIERNLDEHFNDYFEVTFEDTRSQETSKCTFADFTTSGIKELESETNTDIHWALYVCKALKNKSQKRSYWQQFRKYELNKDVSTKKELAEVSPLKKSNADFDLEKFEY
jgi:hypothetical protein